MQSAATFPTTEICTETDGRMEKVEILCLTFLEVLKSGIFKI
jgi:hypothetical protein